MGTVPQPDRKRITWICKPKTVIRGGGYGWNLIITRVPKTGRGNPQWIAAAEGDPEIRIGEFRDRFSAVDAAEEWAKANRRNRDE